MPAKFKSGDLVILNQYGIFITNDHNGKIGVIVSESYNIIPHITAEEEMFYLAYDVLINGELFKMVPQDFLESYKNYEKDNKQLDSIFDRKSHTS